jgi:LuxR family maltose regulon positive regulatory protein
MVRVETKRAGETRPLQLLATKLHPPARREQTIPRDRLVERLHHRPGIKLTVVAAPAGSGKTTLLGEWRELAMETKPVAWLSVDKSDNDPVVLWSYVLAALREALPALEVSASPRLVGTSGITSTFLPELINELTELGNAALVVDDFHMLSNRRARESFAWFIDHIPSDFQLVLGTRSESALPLAKLRAHGTLLELRAQDLSFTLSEAELFLNDRLALDLETEYVDGLVSRTEGWPAGLYLAGLSLQGAEDRQGSASRFGGDNRNVVDFLVDEVLATYDTATQELMLRSSILDRLCGPLCDAVLEQDGSAERLRALSRSNLFLIPLDDQDKWYRFHHLFARLLRAELEHRDPGLTPALHRRALAWYRENEGVDEAIAHAIAAGAFEEASELIAGSWTVYTSWNRLATVFRWLEGFPRERLCEDQVLLAVAAWVHSLNGDRDAAMDAITELERLGEFEAGPLPDGFSSIEASLTTLRALIAWGDNGYGLRNARRAVELEPPGSPWRAVVCFTLGARLYFSGDFDEADRWLGESAELPLDLEQCWVAPTAYAYRSLLAGDRNELDQQALFADRAVDLARELEVEGADPEVFVALGASLEARGELERALEQLEQGVAGLRARGHPLALAVGTIRLASVLRALGQRDASLAAIDEARAALDSCRDPGNLRQRLTVFEGTKRAARESTTELSRSELMILRLLTGTLTERDIGRELYLSHSTIHSHAKSIYRKLGVSSRMDAIQRGRELGLI